MSTPTASSPLLAQKSLESSINTPATPGSSGSSPLNSNTPKVVHEEARNWLGKDGLTSIGAAQAVLILLFALFTRYDGTSDLSIYPYEADVSIMIFVGFGFLMTFLKKFSYSAVGFNFLVSAFVLQWTILVVRFFTMLYGNGNGPVWDVITLDEGDLTNGQFGAAAVMISFGALLGKVSADQMFWLGFLEIIFYGLNIFIGSLHLQAYDVGGSIFIHSFGAFFGLAASIVLSPKANESNYKDNANSYHSDVFSFVGTTFLWILWPSFNAALALPDQQQVITINTLLALTSSCLTAFYISRTIRGHGRFEVVDIQNATLAGGVAVGASSNLCILPAGAMGIGAVAGAVSTLGYIYVQPYLQEKIGLYDTCGVHNLHGMPGVVGILSVALATAAGAPFAGATMHLQPYAHGSSQVFYQLAAGAITLAIAISSGLASGWFVKNYVAGNPADILFSDEVHWAVPTNVVTFSADDFNAAVKRTAAARQSNVATARWKLLKASMAMGTGGGKGGIAGIARAAAAAKAVRTASSGDISGQQ